MLNTSVTKKYILISKFLDELIFLKRADILI